jgi:pimeloyl-ACP methyl ester carboxylesterase
VLTALADGRLLADKTGSTPPVVVALHGWARSGADFSRVVAGLDAVSPHFPGFGTTEPPSEAWGSEEYAALVGEAILPWAPVVLVGHSFGGRVAVRIAARHPELVSGLVLTGVPLLRLAPRRKPALGFRIVKALARLGIVSQKTLEAQRRKRGSADYNAATGVMRDVLVRVVNETYEEDLARIKAPVRMVWGANDTSAPADAAEVASTLIPQASLRVVPGAGHLLEGDLEGAVREELLALLAEVGK